MDPAGKQANPWPNFRKSKKSTRRDGAYGIVLYVLEVLGVKSSGLSLKPESIYTSLERAYTERTLNTYITYLLRNENSLKYTVWHYTLPTRIEGKKKTFTYKTNTRTGYPNVRDRENMHNTALLRSPEEKTCSTVSQNA